MYPGGFFMSGGRRSRCPMTWENDELRTADHGYPTRGRGRERGSQGRLSDVTVSHDLAARIAWGQLP
jgi:hypothetical protein